MKYIDILVNLEKEAIKMYKKWLDFSFSAKSKHLKNLALFMLNENEKHNGNLDVYYRMLLEQDKSNKNVKDKEKNKKEENKIRKAAWEVMYPQEGKDSREYDERDLDREVSKITRNLESFLFYYFSREKEVEKNMMLVQKYSDWGLDAWAAQLIKDTDSILSDYNYDDAVKLTGYKLQYDLIFLKKNIHNNFALQKYKDFMSGWISRAMYQICLMNLQPIKGIVTEELPLFPKEVVLKWIETQHEIVQKKDILLFYKVHLVYQKFLRGEGKVEDIKELIYLMQSFKDYPKPDHIKNMFRICLHAANKIQDKSAKLTILWELYTLGIKTELIFVNGLMLPGDLFNIQKLRMLLDISPAEWDEKVGEMPNSKKTIEVYDRLLAKLTKVQTLFKLNKYDQLVNLYWGETVYEKAYYEYYKFQIKMYYLLAKFAIQDSFVPDFYDSIRAFNREINYFGSQVADNKELTAPQKKVFSQTVKILILLIQKKYISSAKKIREEIEKELAGFFSDDTFEVYEKEFLQSKMI